MFSILKAAYGLDVFDLNFVYSNEGMKTLEWPSTSLKQKGFLTRVAAFMRDFVTEVGFSLLKERRPIKKGTSYFFVHSQNQKNAVSTSYVTNGIDRLYRSVLEVVCDNVTFVINLYG